MALPREERLSRQRDRMRLARLEDPERNKRRHVKHRYGLTLEEYDELTKQPCAICGEWTPPYENGRRSMHIDHDHTTGAIRACLCALCNKGLGQFRDDPALIQKAARYLMEYGAKKS